MSTVMDVISNPGGIIAAIIDWARDVLGWLFDGIKNGLETLYGALADVLLAPPVWALIAVLVLVALAAKGPRRGWQLALGTGLGFGLIAAMDLWQSTMATLALVLVASVIALALAIPLGIWAAKRPAVWNAIRPVLDFMQTLPAFVYLIPTITIFLTGPVPGIVATIVFAMAPGVRFTHLGIKQVDKEVVEAGESFGSTPGRILRQIQLPLAMPTIMAGVNQVIMLALSMVVIAGLVGAGGLGNDVVSAMQRVQTAAGFNAGIAVVILAMFLDRITSALGERSPVAKAQAQAAARG